MSNLFDDQAFKQSAAISLFHGKDLILQRHLAQDGGVCPRRR
jgi:hypothetical protein